MTEAKPSTLTEYTFSEEALNLTQSHKLGSPEFGLNKMFGTCTANVTGDGGSPGWVWSNEAGAVLGYNLSLPSCTGRSGGECGVKEMPVICHVY